MKKESKGAARGSAEELRAVAADRDLWRKALCEVLGLVPQHYEEFEQVCIGQSPGGDPEKGEHPKGEWVAWDAEYPEDGSVSLNVMAAPPHIAQVMADEELSSALINAEARIEELKERLQKMDAELVETRAALREAKRTVCSLLDGDRWHRCPEWDEMWISDLMPEFEACLCHWEASKASARQRPQAAKSEQP